MNSHVHHAKGGEQVTLIQLCPNASCDHSSRDIYNDTCATSTRTGEQKKYQCECHNDVDDGIGLLQHFMDELDRMINQNDIWAVPYYYQW